MTDSWDEYWIDRQTADGIKRTYYREINEVLNELAGRPEGITDASHRVITMAKTGVTVDLLNGN